jgi:hypothetical protein
MFTFEFIEGSPDAFLKKENVILTDEMSLRLFGTIKSIGKPLTLLVGESKKEVSVGGIVRKPHFYSSFNSSAYLNYENYFEEFTNERKDDWRFRSSLFVLIANGHQVETVREALQTYRKNNNDVRSDFQIKRYDLTPFFSMARWDSGQKTQHVDTRPAGPRSAVLGSIVGAILIILLGCLNLTNTFTAISSTRLKEIGIRKVMGSDRKHLVGQFLGETFIIVSISVFVGLQIAEFFLEGWNAMWPWVKLEMHYLNRQFLIYLAFVTLAVCLLSGAYPAFYISHFKAANILKGKMKFGGTNYLTRSLLVLQFCIAVMCIVFALAFIDNAKYQRAYDLGFNQTEVVFTRLANYSDYETYRHALESQKDISSIAGSRQHLLYSTLQNQPIKYQNNQLEADLLEVGAEYRQTMGFTLLQGRDFKEDSETDRAESIMVTESLAKEFQWDNPIGKEIIYHDTVKLSVIGVLKDVYTQGLWRKMDPMILRLADKQTFTYLIVSAPAGKILELKTVMEKQWKELFPDKLFSAHVMNDLTIQAITVNENLVIMFTVQSIVAILLSSIGLFALVSLNIVKRMKEIGVRKVLGATVAQITFMVNQEFFMILTLSFIGGCIASYYLANGLMGAIWQYYQATSLFTFVGAGVTLLLIAGSTIVVKVFKAASINPAETLKEE